MLIVALSTWRSAREDAGALPVPVAQQDHAEAAPQVRLEGPQPQPQEALFLAGEAPGTGLFVARHTQVRVLANDARQARFELKRGMVVAEIGVNEPGFVFEVETPVASVRAWGTVFTVSVLPDGEAFCRVAEGVVEILAHAAPAVPIRVPAGTEIRLGDALPVALQADALHAELGDAVSFMEHSGVKSELRSLLERGPVTSYGQEEAAQRRGDSSGETSAFLGDERPAQPEELEAVAQLDPLPGSSAAQGSAEGTALDAIDELTRRAQILLLAGEHEAACQAYQDLIREHSASGAALNSEVVLGQIKLDSLGLTEESLAHFQRYLERLPAGILAEEAALGRVRALNRLNRAREVVAAASELLMLYPLGSAYPEVLRTRADALCAVGEIALARKDYEEVIQSWPSSPQVARATAGLAACQAAR